MATVEFPSPGLFASVLHTLWSADSWSSTVNEVMAGLIHSLDEERSRQLPTAIVEIMPLLRRDPEKRMFAAEILVRFDMFEAAEALFRIALEVDDYKLVLAAATLAGNPGVCPTLRDRLSKEFPDDRLIQIRLYDHIVPTCEKEQMWYKQQWPGAIHASTSDGPPFAPVVVLDRSLPAITVTCLANNFIKAGAVIRQLATDAPIPKWFGDQTIVISSPQTRNRILSKTREFNERHIIVEPQLENDSHHNRLFMQCDALLPNRSRLRLPINGSEHAMSVRESSVWEPDVFQLGSYKAYEAQFLSAVSKSTLYKLAKQDILRSHGSFGRFLLSFKDVVAIRSWRYLANESPKRISTSIIKELLNFPGDEHAIRVGVTSYGDVMADHGEGWVNVKTGEQPLSMEITDIDQVFRPFWIGGGYVPDLLHASENTRLHPTILYGEPHLEGHRISAQSLAELDNQGGEDAIRDIFPALENLDYDDTVKVGHQLIGSK